MIKLQIVNSAGKVAREIIVKDGDHADRRVRTIKQGLRPGSSVTFRRQAI
jgi:hypothetical protein